MKKVCVLLALVLLLSLSSSAWAEEDGWVEVIRMDGMSVVVLGDNTMMTVSNINGGAFNIQAVSSSTFYGVTMRNLNATGSGGAIYLNSGSLTLEDSIIYGNRAASGGGAVYLVSGAKADVIGGTINGNNSHYNGAGIYVDTGAKLRLSGNPNFGGTGLVNDELVQSYTDNNGNIAATGNFSTTATNDLPADAKNGGKPYQHARQDIYLANDNEKQPASILVSGNLTGHDGTIWVWPEKEYHYKQLMPFAKLDDGVSGGNLMVFRDARPDAETENSTSTYLYGTPEGETAGYVYWSGLKGSRTVILRKVVGSEAQAGSLAGMSFTVYRQGESKPYDVKHEIKGADGVLIETLENLTSGANGVFWVGELPFGEYNIVESDVSDYYFRLVVGDKDGETELPDGYRITRVSRS